MPLASPAHIASLAVLPFLAGAATASDVYEGYSAELLYQEKRGLLSRTVKVKDDVNLRSGRFVLTERGRGNQPLLVGEVTIDEGSGVIRAAMTVCRRDQTPCEPIARPVMRFAKGNRARYEGAGDDVYFEISFNP